MGTIIKKAFTNKAIYNYYVNGTPMCKDDAILYAKSHNIVPTIEVVKSGLPLETKCGIISACCMALGVIVTMVTM